MTFSPNPAEFAKAVERHLRNSHAIGRLVVGGVLSRLPGVGRHGEGERTNSDQTVVRSGVDPVSEAKGLPLPEDEWRVLGSGDVVEMVRHAEIDTVRAIGRYEESHRRRRLVIEAVRQRLES